MYGDTISIIVPVFNAEPYIETCLESILEQTYQDLEILIVDDGSADRSLKICREYARKDPRIRLFWQPRQGAAAARKLAGLHASGTYLGFVDADDRIEKDMFDLLIRQMEGCDLVTSGYFPDLPENVPAAPRFDGLPAGSYPEGARLDDLLDHMILLDHSARQGLITNLWNKLFRTDIARNVFQAVNTGLTFAEDCEFLYRYLLQCRCVRITDICCYHHRLHGGSLIHQTNRNYLKDLNDIYHSLEPLFRSHPRHEALLAGLQRWIVLALMYAPRFMGFGEEAQFDLKGLDYIYED